MTHGTLELLLNILMMVGILFVVYGLYFCFVGVFGLKKHRGAPAAPPAARFAVVVAARNEQEVIGNLLDSLWAQNYPRALYDVYVAPNNCTDNTRGVALAHGAKIFEPKGRIRAKGDVLRQITKQLMQSGEYDAMCVFDADNLAHPDFLQSMNNALQNGAQAAQGRRECKNPWDSGISTCYTIYYWLVNRFYNGGREALGLSSLIVGSGYMVSMQLLQRMGGWNTSTLTEDYEFSAQCVMAGQRVVYVPQAVNYDELPLTFAQSWKQRRRWTTGFVQGMEGYLPKLMSEAVRQKSFVIFDMALVYISPVVQLLSLLSGAASLALGAYGVMQLRVMPMTQALALVVLVLALLFAGCCLFAAVVLRLSQGRRIMRRGLVGVLSFAIFLISWVPIGILSLFVKTTHWEAIPHTRALALPEDAR